MTNASKLDIIQKPSPNHREQNGIAKTSITLHWMVGTLAGTDRHFANPKSRVATHYGIQGDKVHQYVDEKDYAFANGDKYANQTSISIEHEGGQMLKSGKRKKPTKKTHNTSAVLCAEIALRHNIGKLELGENVFPHKHWVATACPGSLDIQYIINEANKIIEAKLDGKETEDKSDELDGKEKYIKVDYHVRPGDNLTNIAKRFRTTVASIVKENDIKNASLIHPWQLLHITTGFPVSMVDPYRTHEVRTNESLWKIAKDYGTTVEQIVKDNNIKNASLIFPGQKLKIKRKQ